MGSVGASKSINSNIPKINNPANIPNNAMTEQEYLDLVGYGDHVSGAGIDRYAGANMTRMTEKARKRTRAEINAQANQYFDNRAKAKAEYKRLIDSGVIRDKTGIEKIITRAHENPELSSTQAARRMAEKKGYDWKTGKKLK